MKKTLEVINRMKDAGVISRYAIGDAIGATFYLEPISTFDIDVFISLRAAPGSLIVSLAPIYSYLQTLGYTPEHEHVVIEDWQVQFLPADDALYAEALSEAVEIPFEGAKIWVMTAEHLMAIALQTGRQKDTVRLNQFLAAGVFDPVRLNLIVSRHGLSQKWTQFKSRHTEDSND
jgi:hypothetical protein